jgi:hypothetical protein
MNKTEERRGKRPTILIIILLIFIWAFLQPQRGQAQWTAPNSSGNISNTNTGNVGVGTSTPVEKLSISGNLRLDGTSDGLGRLIQQISGGNQFEWYPKATGLFLYDRTSGQYRISFLNNGNIGIGTTTPATTLHSLGGMMATWAGTNTNYYGGGRAGACAIYGDAYGNGGAYSYCAQNSTATNPALFGGMAGGYFRGGNGSYGGGGAGVVALGGDGGNPENVNSGGGAGLFAKGGLDGNGGAYGYAGYFAAGNVVVMNGNVGIGAVNPAARLYVVGADGLSNYTSAAAPDAFYLMGGMGGNGNWYGSAGGAGGGMTFQGGTGGVPVAGSLAALGGTGGNINITGGQGGPNTFGVGGGAGGNIFINGGVGVGNVNGNVILSNLRGNVGIGTASPAYKLDVSGAVRSSSGGFVFPDGTVQTTAASGGGGQTQWVPAANGIYYNSGNVGIGTATPAYKLDVAGQINVSGGFCIAGDCKASWSQVGGASQWATSGSNIYYNTGSIGIGTASPAAKIDIVGPPPGAGPGLKANGDILLNGQAAIFFDNNYSYANGNYIRAVAGNTQAFFTAGVERMRVASDGNVGIGTNNPLTHRLYLKGAALPSFQNGTQGVLAIAGAGFANNYMVPLDFKIGEEATYGNTSQARIAMRMTASGSYLLFGTSNSYATGITNTALAIDYSGNVGIGKTDPQAPLDVQGNVNVTGNITATGVINAKYQDVAEWVKSSQKLSVGTVVILDPERTNQVIASTMSYDTRVAGVITEQPGLLLGEGGESKVKVATTGRVRVKVDATRGAIKIGDLLVTSDLEGVAMKSEPINLQGRLIHSPGTIIGKALERLEQGKGEILVLLSLQ